MAAATNSQREPDPGYAKYDAKERLAIGKVIREEWDKMKGEVNSADHFIEHVLKVLVKAGFKSPAGKKLTERTVRYQVFRNGIRFRKSDRRPAAPVLETPMQRPSLSMAPASAPQTAAPAVPGMTPLLQTILTDATLSAEQREALIKAYYGVK